MKSFIAGALAAVTVIFGSCQALQLPKRIGTCTFIRNTYSIRSCNTEFFQQMIRNPKSNCSAELTSVWDCVAEAAQNCIPGPPVSHIGIEPKFIISKEMMCDLAGLEFPRSVRKNKNLPCNLTKQQDVSKINTCSDGFITMWKANRGHRVDPELCGEVAKSRACVKDTLENKCNFTNDQWFRDQADFILGVYNPFCAKKVGPTTMTPSPTTGAKRTSTASAQSTLLKGIVVVFVAIVTLLFA